jgi:hypothetical protein
MTKIVRNVMAIILITKSSLSFGQTDSTNQNIKNYRIIDRYPLFHLCKNCRILENRPQMLCGHNYNTLITSYTFDGNHWAEIGFAKDITSCFPDKGSDYLAAVISIMINQRFANSFRLVYLKDNLFGLQFYFIKYGLNIEALTDYKNTDVVLRPEIRLCDNMDYSALLKRINISYGYNFKFNDKLPGLRQSHQIIITLNLFNHGWIS